jgi:hypothetical protein
MKGTQGLTKEEARFLCPTPTQIITLGVLLATYLINYAILFQMVILQSNKCAKQPSNFPSLLTLQVIFFSTGRLISIPLIYSVYDLGPLIVSFPIVIL